MIEIIREFYLTLNAFLGSEASLLLGAICMALLLFVSLRNKKSVPIYSLVALLNVLFVPSALFFAFNY
ncbi:hypothetical protein [Vibrio sp. 1180_3]|uniref:hypothetical protein n=1 Tax=Vibrio sp. 1180_3 TaxID=2528832 RepID=UPI0024069813|nr:hypothetical protein [Vibrio sp. 1180_3]MDF9399200.1 hypothetical protein [Vibrio sp. 1180_3]